MASYFLLTVWFLGSMAGGPDGVSEPPETDPARIIARMQAAYEEVLDYQAELEVRHFRDERLVTKKRLRYTFKKPNRIRVDFRTPYPGLSLTYPSHEGRVEVHPPGWLRFFAFTLDPGNNRLRLWPGQRIDQTHLGLLIGNIAHSLTTGRRGPLEISLGDRLLRVRVVAVNHFIEDQISRYTFHIHRKKWLPVFVGEIIPKKNTRRTIRFHDLAVNPGVPDGFFHPNEPSGSESSRQKAE